MGDKQALVERVRAATAEGPYLIEETPDGFDMEIDIVDAKWYTLIRANGLTKVFTYSVKLDEEQQQYSITDIANTVRWSAGPGVEGPPELEAEVAQQRGRVYQKSFGMSTGVDARTGAVGVPMSYSFNSGEGRNLIREVAKEAGWSEAMGSEQKIGLWVAAITVALLVIIGIVALVVALVR